MRVFKMSRYSFIDLKNGTKVDDMMEELTGSEIDVARDTLIAVAPDGTAIGFAFANRVTNPEKPRVFLFGKVHPTHQGRGIGRALLRWTKARAEEILDGHPGGTVQVQNFEGDARAIRLCESEGARAIRWFAEMVHTFANTNEEVASPLPAGSSTIVLSPSVRAAHCFSSASLSGAVGTITVVSVGLGDTFALALAEGVTVTV